MIDTKTKHGAGTPTGREQAAFRIYATGPFGPERPPCLPPRRRRVRAEVQERIETWTRAALSLAPSVAVEVVEWISNDPRTQAVHSVLVSVEGRGEPLRFEIASERVTEAAIGRAVGRGIRTPPPTAPPRPRPHPM